MPTVHLLDYVAGNIRSLVNAIEKIGYTIEWVKTPADIVKAEKLIIPGVGHFGHCMSQLAKAGYVEPIQEYIQAGKPFMGICVGLQALFQGSEEDALVPGLGLIPGQLKKFQDEDKSVPHIGWNSANTSPPRKVAQESLYGLRPSSKYYYVHSYAAPYREGRLEKSGWTVATARYGNEEFVGAIAKDNIFATQFHPEKSGAAGMRVIKAFLEGRRLEKLEEKPSAALTSEGLTRRVIACLDVRTNDQGDLVVTKGDQYDVREKDGVSSGGAVRNLGKPVDMAKKYYEQGADEVTFLNITSFRNCPVADTPMLEILRRTSETVFVPLTIGGGIRDTVDTDGTKISALDIATMYFKSGADKVSIGSDAVIAAEDYYTRGKILAGNTAIETISAAYGNQAVVVSVDPRRVYVSSPSSTSHHTIKSSTLGPNDEEYCWYQCTIKGGREGRDFDVRQLVVAVEAMGAGEILLNCIDKDGTNSGFDLELINDVKQAIKIPVIASSGAGNPGHFRDVFEKTTTDAALGAGMFHRGEYTVKQVKEYLQEEGLLVRQFEEMSIVEVTVKYHLMTHTLFLVIRQIFMMGIVNPSHTAFERATQLFKLASVEGYDGFDSSFSHHLTLLSATHNPTPSHPHNATTTFSMTVPHTLCNMSGSLHGGAVALIFDICTSITVAIAAKEGFWDRGHVSRTLNCTYLRPAAEGQKVLVESEVVHLGRRMGVVRGVIRGAEGEGEGKVYYTCEHGRVCLDGGRL